MTLAEQFIRELKQEAATTRRVLERVPEAQFAWKPHQKSMSLGQLAMHIAMLPRGIAELLRDPVTEPPTVPLVTPLSVAEILAALEVGVAFATEALSSWGDEGLAVKWQMQRDSQTLLEMPRAAMVRSVMLNHAYHHRGQLTVYLRMLDVALPPVYGPTADEQLF